jgi:hypothetical protein
MVYGKDIADKAPPPNKLKGYASGGKRNDEEPAGDEMGEDDEETKSAVAVSQFQEFMDSLGLTGDARKACELLEQYLDTVGYRK